MNQVVGLIFLVLLLAFSLTLFALASAALRAYREGDIATARRPIMVFTVLAAVVSASIATWANAALAFALANIGYLIDWAGQMLLAYPLSWIGLGPLAVGAAALLLSPGPRGWIGENYLVVSVITLIVAATGWLIASLLTIGGGWPIVAIVILLGVVAGLGNHGLMFVPHLDDGPRIGESSFSAIPRIAGTRVRRNVYRAGGLLSAAPQQFIRKETVIATLAMAIIAAAWLLYTNRPPESPRQPIISTPGPSSGPTAPAGVVSLPSPTSAPQIIGYKITNTDGQGILLREQPSRESKVLLSLADGASVEPADKEVVEAEGIKWQKIKVGGGVVGWTSTEFLQPAYALGFVKVTNTGGEGVLLRAKPGKVGGAIGVLQEGNELRVVGPDVDAEGKTWRNVSDAKGTAGWASAEYLTPINR
ncbi:MAG: SH3 domain-containing protein [Chloroflexi bacterium]|nr:SH3 domain-containing protein [Chloroflexota bacterium]